MNAPIALFVYNRPVHTRRTIAALGQNTLALESDLIIFSDGARAGSETEVKEVRKYLATVSGFRDVKVIERDSNYGLARSITTGVTDLIETFGEVIVLEDDMVTSPGFLAYMNEGLNFYRSISKVWHISGWCFPVEVKGDQKKDVYLWRGMNCWGWATWADRWQHYNNDPDQHLSWPRQYRREFDLNDSGLFWSQMEANRKHKINTWAVYWYATIYQHDGLCADPYAPMLQNIGIDGSGHHFSPADHVEMLPMSLKLNHFNFEDHVEENNAAVDSIQVHLATLKLSFLARVRSGLKNRIRRLLAPKPFGGIH
ncbi:MAG: hypothetical protein ACJAXW_003278 [Candidatus Azotimanducaceae bacterium]|jgi:hypothetical protein